MVVAGILLAVGLIDLDRSGIVPAWLEVLTAVTGCEQAPARVATLRRHANLMLADAEREIANQGDLADLRQRHAAFEATRQRCDPSAIGDINAASR